MRTQRLSARPGPVSEPGPTGLIRLGLAEGRDGQLFVPAAYAPERPVPLILTFHGAGGNAQRTINYLIPVADAAGIVVLAPDSRGQTWDIMLGDYGPDVAFIDRALKQTFARYAIQPERVVISGFSDGASYALSLGLMNGDLFPQIIAFSPGFMALAGPVGEPRIFISHGTEDAVLPIERCSRRLVPQLEDAGYDVTYHEFNGPHTVPPATVAEAITWLLQPAPIRPTSGH